MIFEVELKKIPAVKVISLRGIIPKYNEEGILWERLGRFIGEKGIACHIDISIPVDALGESEGDFIYQEYEEIPLAATLCFTGVFDGGYDAASEKFAHWMEENNYAFAGNLRGHVLVSPEDEPNPEKWKTELQVPVVKR